MAFNKKFVQQQYKELFRCIAELDWREKRDPAFFEGLCEILNDMVMGDDVLIASQDPMQSVSREARRELCLAALSKAPELDHDSFVPWLLDSMMAALEAADK